MRPYLVVVPVLVSLLVACSAATMQPPPLDAAVGQDVRANDAPSSDASRDATSDRALTHDDVNLDAASEDTAHDASMGTADTGIACTSACPANSHCVGMSCQCDPYFVASSSGCAGITPTDPAGRSDSEVCAQWTAGHVTNASTPYDPGATMCDPGSMSRDAINDALRRLNMYRWLVGLTPVTDDTADDARDQACALIESIRGLPGASNPNPHSPTSAWTCYTPEAASAAGSSNIAWGGGSAAGSMDIWMQDFGNDSTLGHRRWMLHPPLGPIGIGYAGGASCLEVFGSSGGGTSGPWYAYPPPGPVPVGTTMNAWSWHTPSLDASHATVSITRMSDGMNLAVTMLMLSAGFGDSTVAWFPSGWGATAGESYTVTVSGVSSASVSYVVRVINCP